MKVSNRVKCGIRLALVFVGLACCVARAWAVFVDPASGRNWFELCGIILLTYLCFDGYLAARKRLTRESGK